jgi:hypothetical protein
MCAVAGGAASQTAQICKFVPQLCQEDSNGAIMALGPRPESEAVYDMF